MISDCVHCESFPLCPSPILSPRGPLGIAYKFKTRNFRSCKIKGLFHGVNLLYSYKKGFSRCKFVMLYEYDLFYLRFFAYDVFMKIA